MQNQEKFMEIYGEFNWDGQEKYVDVLTINGHIYKRFFSNYKFTNANDIDRFIESAIIDKNCLVDKQTKNCTILKDSKTGETTYYIYRSELLIEKVVLHEIGRLTSTELKEQLNLNY